MKVIYNSKLNAYQVIYKDLLAQLSGKSLYTRKQFGAGKTKPNLAERKARIKELEKWANEQEEKSEQAALEKQNGNTSNSNSNNKGETPILVVDYLTNIKGDDLATTKVEKQRKAALLHLQDFIKFIESNHKGLYLHQVNKKIALEFMNDMDKKGRSYHYKKVRWMRLGFVFNMVMNKFEDSEFKYRNPFYALKIDKIAEEEPVNHKKTFSPEVIKLVLKEALEFSNTKKAQPLIQRYQRWAILYLMTLTGIRPKDIVLLKWEQINMTMRTITFRHYKTKKKGINTVLYMTPHLMDLFNDLKNLHQTEKVMNKDFVFSFWSESETTRHFDDFLYTQNMLDITKFFVKFRERHGLTEQVIISGKRIYAYCPYSLRATVGTLLTWANFNQNSIDYLQGHAPNNTTARFYLNHEANPKAATADMLNYMAFHIVEQPLGKYGLEWAYKDQLIQDKENRRTEEIKDSIRTTNNGMKLIAMTLEEKLNEEKRFKNDLTGHHGEDLSEFLQSHQTSFNKITLFIHGRFFGISFFLI